jgi:hypothetical protein
MVSIVYERVGALTILTQVLTRMKVFCYIFEKLQNEYSDCKITFHSFTNTILASLRDISGSHSD